jgi:DNA repair ATPase RecN
MTPEEIQSAFEAQLQINQAISRDVAILVERQQSTDKRLDRLSDLTERYINSSSNVIQRLDQAAERMIDVQLQTFRVIEEMQAEVRGLQTENKRILDHLFGERGT